MFSLMPDTHLPKVGHFSRNRVTFCTCVFSTEVGLMTGFYDGLAGKPAFDQSLQVLRSVFW